jgi:hypothetical protein
VRQLAALLHIAVALDAAGTQAVRRIETRFVRRTIWLRIAVAPNVRFDFRGLRRYARLFEQEFGMRMRFGRIRRTTLTSDRISSLNAIRRSAAAPQRRSAA